MTDKRAAVEERLDGLTRSRNAIVYQLRERLGPDLRWQDIAEAADLTIVGARAAAVRATQN